MANSERALSRIEAYGGDNWDEDIYGRVFAAHKLKPFQDLTQIKAFVESVFLDENTKSFARYATAAICRIAKFSGGREDEIFFDLVSYLVDYYSLNSAYHFRLRNLERDLIEAGASQEQRTADPTPRIFVTFQYGLPLLLPATLSILYKEPVGVFAHRHNPKAVEIMTAAGGSVLPIYIEDVNLFKLMRGTYKNTSLIGNIDTVYPGSRSAVLPMLGCTLRVTTGMIEMTRSRKEPSIRCAALWPLKDDGIDLRIGSPMSCSDGRLDELLKEIGHFFEELLLKHPSYWLAWPNLSGDDFS